MNRLQVRARTNELLLLAVIATVVMLFAGFTAAYLIRRTNADWHPVPLPAVFFINTAILLGSSAALEFSRRGSRIWLMAAIGLGLTFVVGQVMGWRELANQGVFLPTSPHSSFLYMLTAIHGLHVIGGLIALIYVAVRPSALKLVAVYWHFVGAVWLYVLLLLAAV